MEAIKIFTIHILLPCTQVAWYFNILIFFQRESSVSDLFLGVLDGSVDIMNQETIMEVCIPAECVGLHAANAFRAVICVFLASIHDRWLDILMYNLCVFHL